MASGADGRACWSVPDPLLLAVDGNSLLHRAHHAWADSMEQDDEGRPIWGLLGLMVAIGAAAARCEPDALVVGFDCGRRSVRREVFAQYKAHRPAKPAQLQVQLDDAPGLLAAGGVPVVQVSGYEADDVLASAADLARRERWRAVLVTSDRDAFALIDQTTSVLRVVNGGIEDSPMLTEADLVASYQVTPDQYRDLAVLRGDPSDNLPGVAGIGTATAARLLAVFPGLDAVFAAIDDGHEAQVSAVAGPDATAYLASAEGRAALHRSRDVMLMRADLPLPDLTELRLPLDAARLRGALMARSIRLSRSLWALVGEQRPQWTPNGFDRAPAYLPRVETPPWATSQWHPMPSVSPAAVQPRPARRPTAVRPVPSGQLTLF